MYHRFTDRARKVIKFSNQEALRFNHEYVGTEHLLLGLLREGRGVACNVLHDLGLDLKTVRDEVESLMEPGPDFVTLGNRPQTPCTKRVLEHAIDESRSLNHNYVGTEHLLLGLLREPEGRAAQAIQNLNLEPHLVRQRILEVLGQYEETDLPASAHPPYARRMGAGLRRILHFLHIGSGAGVE